MAKITALPVAEPIAGSEFIPIVQGEVTKRLTVEEFRDAITPFLQYWFKGEQGDPGDIAELVEVNGARLIGALGFAAATSTTQDELSKLIAKTVSVRDHGATHDDGSTPQQAQFGAAAQAAPARVTTTAAFAGMPQAPSAEVWVPDGLYHLTDDVDSNNKDITWRCDDGARFTTGSQAYLLGKVVRRGRTSAGFLFGALDHACGASSMVGNGSFDQSPLISGVTSPEQIAQPDTLDGAAHYADITGIPLVHQSSATFTATTAVLSTAAPVRRLRVGMAIQTEHSPYYRGVLTGWSADGRTLRVHSWRLAGTTIAGTPANNGAQTLVNVIHKIWGRNANLFMTAAGYSYQGTIDELGVINNKFQPANAEDGAGRVWGSDVVNLGSFKFSIGHIARGPGYEGFRATGTDVGFNAAAFASLGYAAPAVGFNYTGSGTAFRQLSAGGAQQLSIANGSIELGDLNTASTPFIDFRSSGGAGVDYDARIIVSGGGGTGNGGMLIAAAEVATGILKPAGDNLFTLGTAGYRWSLVWAATGTISTSDPRLKSFIDDAGMMDAAKRAVRRLEIQPYQWLDEIAKKGEERARIHIGVNAQAVLDAFAAKGLDARRFGLFCEDPETRSVETITPVEVPDTEVVEEMKAVSEVVGDAIVLRKKLMPVEKPKTRRLPVLNEDGSPVMRPLFGEPEYEGGRPVLIGEEPAYADIPVMRTKDVVTYEDVPTGETRMGIRYEQLAMLMLAAA